MNLNPIGALTEKLEKLIVEHGSSVIQEKHIALFKDELAILKEKLSVMASEKVQLETEIQSLKAENHELKKKIIGYEHASDEAPLNEIREKILLSLSHTSKQSPLSVEYIATLNSITPQIATFHLVDLEKKSMVHAFYPPLAMTPQFAPLGWYIGQEGLRYLIESGKL